MGFIKGAPGYSSLPVAVAPDPRPPIQRGSGSHSIFIDVDAGDKLKASTHTISMEPDLHTDIVSGGSGSAIEH